MAVAVEFLPGRVIVDSFNEPVNRQIVWIRVIEGESACNGIMLRSKIHRATLTGTELDYEGSIAIDRT